MVPDTWLSVLLFFLLVAPGLLFDLLSARRRAGFSESLFREASRVVLGSLAFSGFAFAVLVIVRTVHPAWMPDPRRLLNPQDPYARDQYRLVFRALVLQESLALTTAWAWHLILALKQGGATIRQVSAWTQVFKRDCPKGHDAYARVRVVGGVVYTGLVAHFTPDLEVDGRELILAQPMASKTGENPLTAVPGQYQRVVIRGSAIEAMSVEYRPKPQRDASLRLLVGAVIAAALAIPSLWLLPLRPWWQRSLTAALLVVVMVLLSMVASRIRKRGKAEGSPPPAEAVGPNPDAGPAPAPGSP